MALCADDGTSQTHLPAPLPPGASHHYRGCWRNRRRNPPLAGKDYLNLAIGMRQIG